VRVCVNACVMHAIMYSFVHLLRVKKQAACNWTGTRVDMQLRHVMKLRAVDLHPSTPSTLLTSQHSHTHTHTHTHTHARTHTQTNTHMHARTHTHKPTHTCKTHHPLHTHRLCPSSAPLACASSSAAAAASASLPSFAAPTSAPKRAHSAIRS